MVKVLKHEALGNWREFSNNVAGIAFSIVKVDSGVYNISFDQNIGGMQVTGGDNPVMRADELVAILGSRYTLYRMLNNMVDTNITNIGGGYLSGTSSVTDYINSFLWAGTPEGSQYWDDLHSTALNYE